MRDDNNKLFNELLQKIRDNESTVISTNVHESEFLSFLYFLVKNFYYAVIVDDYPFEITSKKSLLEALYYQVKLITVHDLNWDAIQEGLGDALNNFLEFDGIVLLFKKGEILKNTLPDEFKVLSEVVQEINRQEGQKKIKIII